MADFNVRSDAVNVEQIMDQIRARIREKRGVDYTEEQIRELASVKLQKFLDPRGVRSDLLEQFRKAQPPYEPPALPNFAFEDSTLYDSHRGPLRFIRRLLNPLLKLFFNPNPIVNALHIQSRINTTLAEREARLEASRRSTESLYYELIHNLVVETTRLGIEVKNLTMRIESMSSRLEFNERRARALEGAVVYKPQPGDIVVTAPPPPASESRQSGQGSQGQPTQVQGQGQPSTSGEGPGQRSRRRRRRRGRRSGAPAAVVMGAASAEGPGESGPHGGDMDDDGGADRPDAFNEAPSTQASHEAPGRGDPHTPGSEPEPK